MSVFRHITWSIALASTAVTAMAQTAAEHTQHHAVTVAQAQTPAAKGAMMPKSDADNPMTSMTAPDEHMKTMSAMHEKMVNAKTPEERSALMAEHMTTMQESMAMMNQIGCLGAMGGMQGMQGMHGMHGMHGGKAMPGNMPERHQMMEKRMDMMQSMMQMMMMQMMVDRMPAAPAK